MTTPTPIAAGDKVTFSHRHFDGIRTETGVVESFVNGRARVRTAPRRITEIGIGALTRIDAAPSPLRRAVDGDFSGEER